MFGKIKTTPVFTSLTVTSLEVSRGLEMAREKIEKLKVEKEEAWAKLTKYGMTSLWSQGTSVIEAEQNLAFWTKVEAILTTSTLVTYEERLQALEDFRDRTIEELMRGPNVRSTSPLANAYEFEAYEVMRKDWLSHFDWLSCRLEPHK